MKHTDWCEDKGCKSVEEKICTVCRRAFHAGLKEGQRRVTPPDIRKLIKALQNQSLANRIDTILGYKFVGRNHDRFVHVKLDKSIKHKECPPWLFIRELEKKLILGIRNCCDPLHRRLGFLYENVHYYVPLTYLREYELKEKS